MKKMEIRQENAGITAKDRFNANTATSLQTNIDSVLTVKKAMIADVFEEGGEPKRVAYLFTDTGVYSTISQTAIDGISDLIDLLDDGEEAVAIIPRSRKSKAGRDFIVLEMA